MNEDDKNVINMAEARKRQRTLQKERDKNQPLSSNNSGVKSKLFQWIQFIMFLALMAYLMRLCSH